MSVHEHTCAGYDGVGPYARACKAKIECNEPWVSCQLVYLCESHAPAWGPGSGLRSHDEWEAIIYRVAIESKSAT